MSDYKGAFLRLEALPRAKELPRDTGYDSSCFRAALAERGITPYIPPPSIRTIQIEDDKHCHDIENVLRRINDRRLIPLMRPHLYVRNLHHHNHVLLAVINKF